MKFLQDMTQTTRILLYAIFILFIAILEPCLPTHIFDFLNNKVLQFFIIIFVAIITPYDPILAIFIIIALIMSIEKSNYKKLVRLETSDGHRFNASQGEFRDVISRFTGWNSPSQSHLTEIK
jgi:hypothetical protein